MKTREFLNLLEQHKDTSLLFEYAPNQLVGANYHITEVKHIAVNSVDCGARTDAWNETIVQLWESPSELGKTEFMSAYKALGILNKVGKMKSYDLEAEVKFEYSNALFHTAQLFVNDYEIQGSRLLLKLAIEKPIVRPKKNVGFPNLQWQIRMPKHVVPLMEDAVKMRIRPFIQTDFPKVASIYEEGIATGLATFETDVPNWEKWNDKFMEPCRLVAELDGAIVGWGALSTVSDRCVYEGVAENTVYVSQSHRGRGIGKQLLTQLVKASEEKGYWTLQAGIFSENIGSIALHESCGFRVIGTREKVAQRNGKWHDNVLMERRSKTINYMKNILVLCTGNSCRSQMAHGYLEKFAKGKANIYSAGIETHGLNPGAVNTMLADGVDINEHTSNHVDEYALINFDFIITVCDHANENCPFIPSENAKRTHHNFSDPSKVKGSEQEVTAAFIKTREEIKEYCINFVQENL